MTNIEVIDNLTERRNHSDTMKFSLNDAYLLETMTLHRESLSNEERNFWDNQLFY